MIHYINKAIWVLISKDQVAMIIHLKTDISQVLSKLPNNASNNSTNNCSKIVITT